MSASTVPPPSAETQLELIKPELERALVVGDAWCLVHIKVRGRPMEAGAFSQQAEYGARPNTRHWR